MSADHPASLPPSELTAPETAPVNVLLVLGPHRATAELGVVGAQATRDLEALHATVRVVSTVTEREALEALALPCEAVVLDPGSLEGFSGGIADALTHLEVPVITVSGRGESSGPWPSAHVVTAAATASITGGGAAAYEAAVEAAAWFAWQCRLDAPGGDVVPTQRIAPVD